jgi:hypothetical protein
MAGNGLIASNFPGLEKHLDEMDKTAEKHLEKYGDMFGSHPRENWIPQNVVANSGFREFDNIVVDRSSVINPVMGKAFRIYSNIQREEAGRFQDGLGVKYFDDNFHTENEIEELEEDLEFRSNGEEFLYRQKLSPGEALEPVADAYERGLSIYYPGSVGENLESALGSLPDDSEIFEVLERDELYDATMNDLEDLGEEFNYEFEDRDHGLLAASEYIPGETAVLTQIDRIGRLSDDYDLVIQSPDITRQFLRHRDIRD